MIVPKRRCTASIAISLFVGLAVFTGCASYFERTKEFQKLFASGKYEDASRYLDKAYKTSGRKDPLLYYLQKATVLYHVPDPAASNVFFENAYIYAEDMQRNYVAETVSFLTNPEITPYRGEDFELVLIHYFKALNYLAGNDLETALVECRRLNIKLNALNDRYAQTKNRYSVDAFALNLMGMIYEASGDINNAFISYRNAYEAYEEVYQKHFKLNAPMQLKKDLLRTAFFLEADDELARFEKAFGMKHQLAAETGGEAVVFWHSGLGPVKAEWSINFLIVRGKGGAGFFVNDELGIAIPIVAGGGSSSSSSFGDLKFVRVAFPKYAVRKPYYRSAEIIFENRQVTLEKAQDINAIALATLSDRMMRELTTALIRLALKQAAEYAVRRQNQNIGALLSIANAVSEKADTRNWQSLPFEIHYARIRLPAGMHTLQVNMNPAYGSVPVPRFIEVRVAEGRTSFYSLNTIQSMPPEMRAQRMPR